MPEKTICGKYGQAPPDMRIIDRSKQKTSLFDDVNPLYDVYTNNLELRNANGIQEF